MVQAVDISGLLSSFDQLGRSNAILAQRKAQQRAEERQKRGGFLRTVGTVGGAAAGAYFGAGNPAAISGGAAIGGAVGGMLSSAEGNEKFNSQEVANAGITAYGMHQSYQANQRNAAQNKAYMQRYGSLENPTEDQSKSLMALSSDENLKMDPDKYQKAVLNITGPQQDTITIGQGDNAKQMTVLRTAEGVKYIEPDKPVKQQQYQFTSANGQTQILTGPEIQSLPPFHLQGATIKKLGDQDPAPPKEPKTEFANYTYKVDGEWVTEALTPQEAMEKKQSLPKGAVMRKGDAPRGNDPTEKWGQPKKVLWSNPDTGNTQVELASYDTINGKWRIGQQEIPADQISGLTSTRSIKFNPDGSTTITEGEGISPTTRTQAEKEIIGNKVTLSSLKEIDKNFERKYHEWPEQLKVLGFKSLEKTGFSLSPENQKRISDLTSHQADVVDATAKYIKQISGVAVSENEAKRLGRVLGQIGDSPTEFKSKNSRAIKRLERINLIYEAALSSGIKSGTTEMFNLVENNIDGASSDEMLDKVGKHLMKKGMTEREAALELKRMGMI